MTTREFQKMLVNYQSRARWCWVRLYIILNLAKIKLLVYIKKNKNLLILRWGIYITWAMKDLSGLEIHHKKWKSFLIQVPLGLGYFPKNADQDNVHLEIKNLNIIYHQNFNKIIKVDNSSHMVKEQFSVTQQLTKFALLKTISIACIILHS